MYILLIQGSNLGPLFFLLFINDLEINATDVKSSDISIFEGIRQLRVLEGKGGRELEERWSEGEGRSGRERVREGGGGTRKRKGERGERKRFWMEGGI